MDEEDEDEEEVVVVLVEIELEVSDLRDLSAEVSVLAEAKRDGGIPAMKLERR